MEGSSACRSRHRDIAKCVGHRPEKLAGVDFNDFEMETVEMADLDIGSEHRDSESYFVAAM